MKEYNTPLAQWRRDFYSSSTGRPTVNALKAAIDKGEIKGGCVAGKYHIPTLRDGQPIAIIAEAKQVAHKPKPATSPIAQNILENLGA